jgi:integrase
MLLRSYVSDLLAAEDLRQSTLDTYASVMANHVNKPSADFDPALGDRDVEDIGPADIRGFFADLRRRGVGPGAIDMVYRLLNKTFRAAVAEETLERNPMRAVKRAKPKKAQIEPPTREELDAIIAHTQPRYRALTELLAWAGPRIGEAGGLTVDCWNAEKRRIKIDQQSSRYGFGEELKTDAAYRDLILPKYVNEALKRHVAEFPPIDGRLFSTRTGAPVTSDNFYGAFKTACRRAGITRKLSPHKLRHHALSSMARAGVPPKAAQAAAGHTSPILTLQVYTHVNDEDLQDIADRMEGAISGVPEQRPAPTATPTIEPPPFSAAPVG